MDQSPVVTFAVNFVAMIPLGQILDAVTEELVISRGGHEGMLILITFSNAVQVVITIIARVKHQPHIVQTSLVGAVISNSVLMVGIGFLFGDINRLEQNFNRSTVRDSSNELALNVAALTLPTAMKSFGTLGSNLDAILAFSRGQAIFLLLSYICFCPFCSKTHSLLFTTPHITAQLRKVKAHHVDAETIIAQIGAGLAASAGGAIGQNVLMRRVQEILLPKMSQPALTFTLTIVTVFLGFNTTFAVDSIDGLTQRTVLTQSFIGLILLPFLGCHPHAVLQAAMRCRQVRHQYQQQHTNTAGILPLAVIIGWILQDNQMTMLFDGFRVVSLAVSILVLKYMTDDGKSNSLDGVALIALYAIIALTAWVTPNAVLGRR